MRARYALLALSLFACSEAVVPPPPTIVPPPPMVEPEPEPMLEEAPLVEPEPVQLPLWMLGVVTDEILTARGGDPVRAALDANTFSYPVLGVDDDGVDWWPVALPEDGSVQAPTSAGRGTLYLVGQVFADAPSGLIAKADGVSAVWINGTQQPGDWYRSGRLRMPLPLEAGENLVVVRAVAARNAPAQSIALAYTPHALTFNLNDATLPHLREGVMSELWIGLPVLNHRNAPVFDLIARVEESELFAETEVEYPALAASAVTPVGFLLEPKVPAPPAAEQPVKVRVRLESQSLDFIYWTEVELETVAADAPFRRTFFSEIDRSVQYYGVVPPAGYDPAREYALILTLHGASVQGFGQARAYSAKDWAYVVAPTNRRPFGFDWEDWGRLDAIEVLDHAQASFHTAPDRVYLTGHSMGGHGTWNVGVTHPGRFAVMAPSAGWESFDSYGGPRAPQGPGRAEAFRGAQQHSQTLDFITNLSRRGVYIIHGAADDNVPVSQGRNMFQRVGEVCEDIVYHEQPGAGHWWDGDVSEGADCVDWPPLMDFMEQRRLDPYELEFSFTSAGPWVNGEHSFLTLQSANDPYTTLSVRSERNGDTLVLTSTNVRAMVLDGDVLMERGIDRVVVDGELTMNAGGAIRIGPEGGKRPGRHGPFKEVFYRPFVFVYPDEEPAAYRRHASNLVTAWAFIGNGHAFAVPASRLTADLRADYNVIYLGAPFEAVADPSLAPRWDANGIELGGTTYAEAASIVVFPEADRLSAVMRTSAGDEALLSGQIPFQSGFGFPDYTVWTYGGSLGAGFFDATWRFDPALHR